MKILYLALAAAIPTASSAPAETLPAGPVAAAVSIPTPAGASRAMIEAGIQTSVTQYLAVPGLLHEYFTVSDGPLLGVHLFSSRVAAQGWFSDAWSRRVVRAYGAPTVATCYDVPVVLDNAEVPASARAAG